MSERISAEFCPSCRRPVGTAVPECACGFSRPGRGWPTDPYIGRMVDGRFSIERRLGAGGMGAVFLATQMHGPTELGKVVLKFLLGEHLHHTSVRNRFVNEARAARQIASPHVVKVFDLAFDEDGAPFMVLEHLQGTSLAAVLESEGRLSPRRAVDIALQIAEAMEECHQKEILHRDLKPANILLQPQRAGDFAKILDFGIARVPQPDGQMTSTLMGTPRYMPPEQIMMKDIDAGVDIFALGVILFEMLAGEPPIVATTPYEYVQLNVTAKPRRLDKVVGGMPAALVDLLDRMLAKERSRRPASMSEVFSGLSSVASAAGWLDAGAATPQPQSDLTVDRMDPTARAPAPRRARRRLVMAAGVALAVTAVAVMLWRTRSIEDGTRAVLQTPRSVEPAAPAIAATTPAVAAPPPSPPPEVTRPAATVSAPAPTVSKSPVPVRASTSKRASPRPDPYEKKLPPVRN